MSLIVGIFGTAIATLWGRSWSLIAGYYRGWADTVISRIDLDVFLALSRCWSWGSVSGRRAVSGAAPEG